MVFSTVEFIFIFLPVFLILYFLVPVQYRNLLLFAGSVVFYAAGTLDKPVYILILLLSVIVNFALGRMIQDSSKPKRILTAGIIYNLAWLVIFKYADFIIENINHAVQSLGGGQAVQPLNLLLPVGISFYTFSSISYLIDVYRHDIKAEKNLINFGTYFTMFPKITTGPITRFETIKRDLKNRTASMESLDDGLRTFALGLGFKVLLADRIGSCWSDIQAVGFESISAPVAWMGIFAYSFQLYFDFYGYSMMAMGLGRIMGFSIPQNFAHPYESLSMTEFWRRWHMSLGSWFRDYVYIPLGGNRRSVPRVYLNLLVVWALTGIWHGAGWNFVIWGLFLFACIAIEKAGLKRLLDRVKPLGHLYMFFMIPLSWMIFAITDIDKLGIYVGRLFDFAGTGSDTVFEGDLAKFWGMYGVLMLICLVMSLSIPERLFAKIRNTIFGTVILFVIFWASAYLIYLGLNDPFLYFRF